MRFEGQFSNPLLGKSKFKGLITYDKKSYKMDFDIKEGEDIYIVDQYNFTGANTTLGLLYTDEEMSSVTLLIFEYDDQYIKSWNTEDGLIFSGDASTREEAMRVFLSLSRDS